MKNKFLNIIAVLNTFRLLPHLLILLANRKIRSSVFIDIEFWNLNLNRKSAFPWFDFVYLMCFVSEYRNIFYARTKWKGKVFNWLCPQRSDLQVYADELGDALYIQHGFGTVIAARKIGSYCWINQGVTIGYSNATDCPTLGDRVTVNAGAVIVGDVYIGNDSIVGANAVVVKSVPEKCTVVGVPARIVRRNGAKVDEIL
ncbi:CysE Serine acetyltransferase [Comamonadaceae bacterium]